MSLHYLVYISRANIDFSTADLEKLAHLSEENNKTLGVTGILIMNGNYFLQVLEGPGTAVKAVFERIRMDPRHRELVIVQEAEHAERVFGEWFMRGINLANHYDISVINFKKQMLSMIDGSLDARKETLLTLKNFSELMKLEEPQA